MISDQVPAYVELAASIAVSKQEEDRFDLLMGVHPAERRLLTEEEEQAAIPASFWDGVARCPADDFSRSMQLWIEHFPELRRMRPYPDREAFHRGLWELAFQGSSVLGCAYAFFPDIQQQDGTALYKACRRAADKIQGRLADLAKSHPDRKGRAFWTFPFAARCGLGELVEERAGLSTELKRRVGLGEVSPGLLYNYIRAYEAKFSELLSPAQFEDLAAELFRAEGWEVHQMRRTKDGGKDLIVSRDDTTAYVQVKRYRNAVGVSEVKEFVATVDADGVKRGFLFTCSHFSRDSRRWLASRRIKLAEIDMIDGEMLWSKLRSLSRDEVAAYLVARGRGEWA